jgi:RecB family exonuclease
MNNDDRLLIFTGPSPRGWHRLQLFLECPQRYAWNYLAGLKGINEDAPPLVKGSLVHLGLAQHYAQLREKQQGRDPKLYFDPIEAIDIMVEAKPHWKDHGELAKRVTEAYLVKWRNERFKVVAVEELLEAQIEGYRFTGRMDLVVEDSEGKIWIIDHKTTGRLQAQQRKFYSVSGQILGYQTLGKIHFGDRFGGMRLNMIQHGGDFKFERFNVDPAPKMMERWPSAVKDAEEGIQKLLDEGRPADKWPIAPSELVCFHRYGPCNYIEQCKWGHTESS